MGARRPFEPERLLVAVLVSPESRGGASVLESALVRLEAAFGRLDFRSEEIDFTWTDYYDDEMGHGIGRLFLTFESLVDPSRLAAIKSITNDIEAESSVGGKRRINLDPGLLSLGRFLLATTKDRAHRIPLSDGIFAELTLIYQGGEFRPLPWTYADWRSDEYRALLAVRREKLKSDLRSARKESGNSQGCRSTS